MTPERWQRAKEIFQAALDRAPDERSAFLASACDGDEALRKEVESLIAAHEKSGEFIDSPAYQAATELFKSDQDLKPGQGVGHYEILSTLGRGGMGEVYLARDSKLGRKLALKFLPSEFTKDAERLRRFEQEAREEERNVFLASRTRKNVSLRWSCEPCSGLRSIDIPSLRDLRRSWI